MLFHISLSLTFIETVTSKGKESGQLLWQWHYVEVAASGSRPNWRLEQRLSTTLDTNIERYSEFLLSASRKFESTNPFPFWHIFSSYSSTSLSSWANNDIHQGYSICPVLLGVPMQAPEEFFGGQILQTPSLLIVARRFWLVLHEENNTQLKACSTSLLHQTRSFRHRNRARTQKKWVAYSRVPNSFLSCMPITISLIERNKSSFNLSDNWIWAHPIPVTNRNGLKKNSTSSSWDMREWIVASHSPVLW